MTETEPTVHTSGGHDLRGAFLAAVDHVAAIVARDDVAAAWGEPSALPEWSVGGLVAHLASQPVIAVELLRADPWPDSITIDEHYRRSAWVQAGVDGDVNVSIRAGGDAQAVAGRDAVLAGVAEAREALPELLAAQPAERAVLIPWAGWALRRDDFLTGRMMEVVVHGEDVAASLGFDSPPLPDEVLAPVLSLLTRLAVRRHGQGALVSALSRAERAPRTISAF
ncbi:maleylpyruvate isomerase N-terminal domain-containing protein [Terrabacter sp. 2RAF25]|uniref:maleylpyruvate isomerase N-terminal domain-containing protein n=1 Tax=Terrabacter sp. 2RAF25 TaxID=3232998 RepID=UPI003F9ADCA8